MKSIIKNQLKNLEVAQIPEFDENTTEFIIKKSNKLILKENHCYLIKLDDILLIPNNKSALTLNWNNGDIPKHKFYKIDASKLMAQMVKVNGIAFDYNKNIDIDEIWSGWLPLKNIEILKEI